MDDCIFCQIVKGSVDSQKVYEDDKVLAFLSIQPIRPGHTLIIPKIHQSDIFDLDKDYYQAVVMTAHKLRPALNEVYKPKRMGLMVAGWDVPHAHLHIVPMLSNHDLTSERLLNGEAKVVDSAILTEDKQQIVSKIKALHIQ